MARRTEAPCRPGELEVRNAAYVLETLGRAVAACQAGEAAGMVTAPCTRGDHRAGHADFRGHTEYLRDACGVDEVVMMLATDPALHAMSSTWHGETALRVALATTHLPLREVGDAVTGPRLTRILRILDAELRHRFGVLSPRILVCGSIPMPGKAGIWARGTRCHHPDPGGAACRRLTLDGPLPADTLFTPHHLARADAVLAMYHDQACRCSSTLVLDALPISPWACHGSYLGGSWHGVGSCRLRFGRSGQPDHCRELGHRDGAARRVMHRRS